MPDINLLEAELRELNMDDYTHRIRGQRPEARNNQITYTEIMIERESPDNISGPRLSRPRDDRGGFLRGRHNVRILHDDR
eukprot:11447335-Heterocapsa_arctica.AAC.1